MVRKGWKQVTLGDIALFQGGSQPPLSVFSSQKKAGYIRLVQIRDYKTDKYATYIPEKLAKRFCKQDDIMIGRYGPPIFQILRGIEGAYNVALIKALPQGVDKEFLYHTLKREDLFQYIDLLSRRTSGQTGVDLTNLKAFELSIPVLTDEQAAIAKALSDVDSLTSSLQKLIEKKKAIKQGAMQELFTGKKRLPGFSGEWSQAPFGDLLDFLPTNAFTRDQMTDTGTIQNVHYGDILTKYGACLDMANTDVPYLLKSVSVRKYSESSYVREGDMIIADTAEDSTVGKCVELVNVHGKVLNSLVLRIDPQLTDSAVSVQFKRVVQILCNIKRLFHSDGNFLLLICDRHIRTAFDMLLQHRCKIEVYRKVSVRHHDIFFSRIL